MKTICVIPSFNEEKTIGWLVRAVRDLGHHVLVIDDGSTDRTARLAREAGAEVSVNPHNMGKGTSLCNAFRLIAERDHESVVIMDGDGQHLPQDIAGLLEGMRVSGADIVVGNRMARSKGMPFVRWLTNGSMSALLSLICRQRVPDTQCGFRVMRMVVLRTLELKTRNFEIESEMLVEAARKGFKISSAPITTVYDGQYSAIHPWRDTLRFFRFIFSRK